MNGDEELAMLPLAAINARPNQPRRVPGAQSMRQLAASVRDVGVLQPIRVRRLDGGYEIIAGERRWRAAQLAGLDEIPALIVDRDDDTALLEALIENIHREDLSLADRADAIRRLRGTCGLKSWVAVAEKLGLSRGHIYRLLSVTKLPDRMRNDPRTASLVEKHVRALVRLRTRPGAQSTLWEQIHEQGLSGDQALAASEHLSSSRAAGRRAGRTLTRVREQITQLSSLVAQLDAAEVAAVRSELQTLCTQMVDLLIQG